MSLLPPSDDTTNWHSGEISALVNIGTHSLALHASGPDRKASDPAVIIIPGLGSSVTGWAAVRRLLAPSIRVLTYDRTGYGDSECSDEEPTGEVIARELSALLGSAHISGPFVLVAHSWAGVLAREFMELRGGDVVGCVFVDANQEYMLDVLDWRAFATNPVVAGVNEIEVTGIQQKHKLTGEEWQVYRETSESKKHKEQAAREYFTYPLSFPVLREKKQMGRMPKFMGNKPVYVIRGDTRIELQAMFEKGLELGNGTKEDRQWCREFLDGWDDKDRGLQKGFLGLSNVGEFVEDEGAGHYVNLTEPETVVEGVMWVLEHVHI